MHVYQCDREVFNGFLTHHCHRCVWTLMNIEEQRYFQSTVTILKTLLLSKEKICMLECDLDLVT